MTDVTELAQSLKAAAEKYKSVWGIARYSKAVEAREKFHELVTPANVIALVEALEKAQQVDEELCKLLPPGVEYMDPPDGGDVTPLEGVRRMVADYRQRIAELESRTVTVKPMRPGHITVGGEKIGIYMRDEVDEFIAALTAAGIKVEAE
ncbi:hypothetical protein [Klebsiella pneumoniae]|uniref:hypothetical protein n=1 Tax=Klebsiella pneumoniae TaxID=573 RepID=UPI003F7A541E